MGIFLLVLAACRRPEPPPVHTGGPGAHSGAHSAAPPTGGTGETAGTGDTGGTWPEVRCADLVAAPEATPVPGPRATHDVRFDRDGNLVGNDGNGLWRWPRGGAGIPWVPAVGLTHQLEWLADGELAVMVADTGSLDRVLPNGARVPLGPGGYAVREGPDGRLWTANGVVVARVDPATGDAEVVLRGLPDGDPKVLAWSLDGRALFVGTARGTGVVWRVPIDAAGDPDGDPEAFATVGAGWHDALALDACGNLYVTDAITTDLYRLDPDGALTFTLDLPTEGHAHGVGFGSGAGGWRADALYLAQPYGGNTVAELVVGVPDVRWRGGRYVLVR